MNFHRPAGDEDSDDDEFDGFMLGDDFKKPNSYHAPAVVQNGPSSTDKAETRLFPSQSSEALQEEYRMSVVRGSLDAVKAILEKGVPVDAVLVCGWTALMYAGNSGHTHIVKHLLEHGADPNYNRDFYTVLMAACASTKRQEEKITECVELLLKANANANTHDRYHMTALIFAAREGRSDVVRLLHRHDAQINKQDSRGWTALSWAACRAHTDAIKTLLECGADVNLKHSDGQRVVDLATAQGHDQVVRLLQGENAEEELGSIHPCIPTAAGAAEAAINPTDLETQTYVKYGELELFLSGLGQGHLIPLFQKHCVDFATFLRLTDAELGEIGVRQIGVRKKILDGIHDVHKKDWENSSLNTVQYSRNISYPDAVAMVANMSKHLLYLGSSVGYICDQTKANPQILNNIPAEVGPVSLQKFTTEALQNMSSLNKQLQQLQKKLNTVLSKSGLEPADLIQTSKRKKRPHSRKVIICGIGLSLAATTALIVWKPELTNYCSDVINRFHIFT